MHIPGKWAIGLLAGGILLGSVVSVAAQTQAPPASATPPANAPAQPGRQPPAQERQQREGRKPRRPAHKMLGAIRWEAVLAGETEGTFRTVRVDRGVLDRVAGSTLHLDAADGANVAVDTSDRTRFRRDGEPASLGDLKAGDQVITHRVKEGEGGFVTRHAVAFSPERWAQMEQRRDACRADPEQCRQKRRERKGERGVRAGKPPRPGGPLPSGRQQTPAERAGEADFAEPSGPEFAF